MKFYGRQCEIKELETLFKQSGNNAKMSVITGRRRIGKPEEIAESVEK
ncbi:ATPase, partial [candidate division TA06 bacterium]